MLRVGAHAAWAVPAIQVASAVTQNAAASGAGSLGVTVLDQSQSGTTLTARVRVTATESAQGVNLTVSGDGTGPTVSFGDVPSGATGVIKTVTATLKSVAGQVGAVSLSAAGSTAGHLTISGSNAVYATSALAFGAIAHARRANESGSVIVPVSASYAPATGVTVKVTKYNGSHSTTTSQAVDVAVGTPTIVTVPIDSFGNSDQTVTVTVTAGTTNNGGHADATRPQSVTHSVPNTTNAATLTVYNESDFNFFGYTILSFRVSTDVAVKAATWSVVDTATGATLATGTATGQAGGTTSGTIAAKDYASVSWVAFAPPSGRSVKVVVNAVTTTTGVPATVTSTAYAV